jgi:hypothetical protein
VIGGTKIKNKWLKVSADPGEGGTNLLQQGFVGIGLSIQSSFVDRLVESQVGSLPIEDNHVGRASEPEVLQKVALVYLLAFSKP